MPPAKKLPLFIWPIWRSQSELWAVQLLYPKGLYPSGSEFREIVSHTLFPTDGTIAFFDELANDRHGKAIALLSERISARYEHLHPNPAEYCAPAWELEHQQALSLH